MPVTIIRPNQGTPKRGEVKTACEELARMFKGEFYRLTSYGASAPYHLVLRLPGQTYGLNFYMGTKIDDAHKELEQVVLLLEKAGLLVSQSPTHLTLKQPITDNP